MIDLTPISEAIILLIIALITTFLIPFIKEKVDANKLAKIKDWVKIAVQAAEQIYIGTGLGEKKKEHVLNFLKEKGYTIDPDKIDNLIESAVFELNK